MRRAVWIFLASIFLPSLGLAWLAVRSAQDQQVVLEHQQVIISQNITDAMAKDIQSRMDQVRHDFVNTTQGLLSESASPLILAGDFNRRLDAAWPLAEIGFAVNIDGEIYSPKSYESPAARAFRSENDRFLSNRENVEVYSSNNSLQQFVMDKEENNASFGVRAKLQTVPAEQAAQAPVMAQASAALAKASPQSGGKAPAYADFAKDLDEQKQNKASESDRVAATGSEARLRPEAKASSKKPARIDTVTASSSDSMGDDMAATSTAMPAPAAAPAPKPIQHQVQSEATVSAPVATSTPATPAASVSRGQASFAPASPSVPADALVSKTTSGVAPAEKAGDGSVANVAVGGSMNTATPPPPSGSVVVAGHALAESQLESSQTKGMADGAAGPPGAAAPMLAPMAKPMVVNGQGGSFDIAPVQNTAPAQNAPTAQADMPVQNGGSFQGGAFNQNGGTLQNGGFISNGGSPNSGNAINNANGFNFASKVARNVFPQKALARDAATLSNIVPEESDFRRVMGTETSGLLSRFLENKLRLMVWSKPGAGTSIVFGAQLDVAKVVEGLRGSFQIPELASDSYSGSARGETCVAILDDTGHPVAMSIPDFKGDWKHPFVATEIGDVLPHWEAALYLVDPEQITRAARTLRATLALIVLVLVIAIVAGGSLIAADVRRQMRLAQQKTDFVSNVSHELKTPLTSIRMFADLLAEKRVPDEERQATYLRIIAAEAARLTRLINNVLDFARMERGKPDAKPNGQPRDCDLVDAMRDVVETCAPHLEAAGVKFQYEVEADRLPIHGDLDALAQIILNLISNAEKYGGNDVLVRVRRQETAAGPLGCVDVLDRGAGIPAGDVKSVFEPFCRLEDSLASGIPGSGLGLTLARRMARSHGGDVTYTPRSGGGSCFTLTIPLTPA